MRTFVTLFILTLSFQFSQAQENPTQDHLSPEQRTELHLKKISMELDLSDNQQKELAKILAEESKEREAHRQEKAQFEKEGKKLSAEERFKKRSAMLDKQKVHRDKMKKLLTEKQFAKWEDLRKEHRKHHKQRKNQKLKIKN